MAVSNFEAWFYAMKQGTMFDRRQESDGVHLPQDPPVHYSNDVAPSSADTKTMFALVVFVSIAVYNVLELTCLIFIVFKKRSGLYFWSLCVATWGIPVYSLGFLLLGLGVSPHAVYVHVTLIVIGWSCTVTGQSVVLYSRLHLLDRNPVHLRFVLVMIIVNATILHPTIAVMIFGANSFDNPSRFYRPYSIAEKVQVSIFFVQETIISGFYIAAIRRLFRDSTLHRRSARRRLLRRVLTVHVVVILLDVTILGLEYFGLYRIQTAYKGLVYSVKLKLEFNILNELINVTRSREGSGQAGRRGYYGGGGGSSSDGSGGDDDYIYDGSRVRMRDTYTMDSGAVLTRPLEPAVCSSRWPRDGGATRKGCVSATAARECELGPEQVPEDGIRIVWTTQVNIADDEVFEAEISNSGNIKLERE